MESPGGAPPPRLGVGMGTAGVQRGGAGVPWAGQPPRLWGCGVLAAVSGGKKGFPEISRCLPRGRGVCVRARVRARPRCHDRGRAEGPFWSGALLGSRPSSPGRVTHFRIGVDGADAEASGFELG